MREADDTGSHARLLRVPGAGGNIGAFGSRCERLCLVRLNKLGIDPKSAIVRSDADPNNGNRSLQKRVEQGPPRRSSLVSFALAAAACALAAAPVQAGPYLLVEADSGRVIAQSNAGQPWFPASVTKLMTAYLAFKAMREHKVEPDTLLKVSANALAQPPSKMGFQVGTEVTLDNAIKMLMVRSANDIAVVIAEGVGGSVESFVHEMNLTAGRLGMDGTRYVNPHGLPNEHQVTTARDMAILARAIIRDFPEYELYFRIPAIQLGKRIIRNHNRLIDRYPGADGMKTGFICSSGFNMVAGATRSGRRLIAVVFGSYSAGQRAEDAARLFERGFNRDIGLGKIVDPEAASVESIRNMMGDPLDMRDEMCNRKRKRPAAESDIDDDEEEETPPAAAGQSAAKGKPAKHSLLADLPPSMPPIRVFTGPPSKVPEEAIAAAPVKPKAEKAAAPKKGETPVRASAAGDAALPSAAAKPATAKPAAKKPAEAPASPTKPKS
jgi:D-alanyl-D-alanine carboxypeptidase